MHALASPAERPLHAVGHLLCGAGLALALLTPLRVQGASQCHGTVAQGRIDGAVKLPLEGPNFRAYSPLAASLGRTHVHERIAAVLVQAFATLQREQPDLRLVYGETGKPRGGPMPPHRTHQNGLSVDLFVPVRDAAGRSVPLPTPVSLRFGYDIEFDAQGRWKDHRIDFQALGAWLRALREAGQAQRAPIARVILEPAYQARVIALAPELQSLPWMKAKPWVRHDEHFHVDFAVACKALSRPNNRAATPCTPYTPYAVKHGVTSLTGASP